MERGVNKKIFIKNEFKTIQSFSSKLSVIIKKTAKNYRDFKIDQGPVICANDNFFQFTIFTTQIPFKNPVQEESSAGVTHSEEAVTNCLVTLDGTSCK